MMWLSGLNKHARCWMADSPGLTGSTVEQPRKLQPRFSCGRKKDLDCMYARGTVNQKVALCILSTEVQQKENQSLMLQEETLRKMNADAQVH